MMDYYIKTYGLAQMTPKTMGKTMGLAQTESKLVTDIGQKLGLSELESNFMGHLSKKMEMA